MRKRNKLLFLTALLIITVAAGWYWLSSALAGSNTINFTNKSGRWLLWATVQTQMDDDRFYFIAPGGTRVARSFPTGVPGSVEVKATTVAGRIDAHCVADVEKKAPIQLQENFNVAVILQPDGSCIGG